MPLQNLFRSKSEWVTSKNLSDALEIVTDRRFSTLYIHSGMNFGVPNLSAGRRRLLESMIEILRGAGANRLVFPTFTFSFCNGETFDPSSTPSAMGAINEFAWKQEGALRSVDPLMSVAVLGEPDKLIQELPPTSLGKDSVFDRLAQSDNVGFLFLGVELGDCFTYMHYLEKLANVDYRYDRVFSGNMIGNDQIDLQDWELFVRYKGVAANQRSFSYANELETSKQLKYAEFGDSRVGCVGIESATELYLNILKQDQYAFITDTRTTGVFDRTFELTGRMVAL